ncbi:phosphoglycerate mutase-like protein [Anaeromyces robustus]|uniref:Phosphoglycerate mutase-like protein n=1 Tax=Anaeromyces robustus TaxID=1754192 RepID=A0A1Y1VRW6_9FUNG|nr:phosphoglycerate mutase-like protein [Anaeromyces robustus]|eukprot:ORX63785.1 phosphoglycerate mutase-like protein [Anaeromyces robustus]
MDNTATYTPDLSGKFLFMRHGQTWFNKNCHLYTMYDPSLSDSHLTDEGKEQIKESQKKINELDIEKVYVSPYYRALETVTIALENYPKIKDLEIIVHPKIAEVVCGVHDYIIDIKQTKKDFNMNSKIKIDWSYFDDYVKNHSKYSENFFYFENIDLVDETEKYEEYLKLKEFYDKQDMNSYKEELSQFLKDKSKKLKIHESLKHAYERFEEFKTFLRNEHKETLNDKNKKVLSICHSTFINTATSPVPISTNKDCSSKGPKGLYRIQNGEIITLFV